MDEDKRKQLASRLYLQNAGLMHSTSARTLSSQRPSLPTLKTVRKTGVLVAKSSSRARLTNIPGRKPKQLQPLSPHIRQKLLTKPPIEDIITRNQRMINMRSSENLHNEKSRADMSRFSGRVSFSSKGKPKKQHIHGEDVFQREEIALQFGKEEEGKKPPTPFEFIQVIKNDPELAEDFWYCNRKGDAYNFEFVPFDKKDDDEYLTISARGVTHFINKEAIFLTLPEWEREYKLYDKLKQINFFAKYKKWKNFSLWKNLRRRNMITERKSHLESELFILDRILMDPLLKIRDKNYTILRWDLVDINLDTVQGLDDFQEAQNDKREKIARELETLEGDIKDIASDSCKESMRDFRRKYNLKIQDEDEEGSPKDKNADEEPFLVGDGSHKQMPYTQEATIRTHYKRLAKFVRLCDYLIADAKQSLSMQSAKKVLTAITHDYSENQHRGSHRSQSQPLLRVDAVINESWIIYYPDCETIQMAVEDAMHKGVTVVCNNEMLLSSPEFEKYMTPLEEFDEKGVDEDHDLWQLVFNDEYFVDINVQIKDGIGRSFGCVEDEAKKLKPYLDKYLENISMDIEMYRTVENEDFKYAIDRFQGQEIEFKRMSEQWDIGIIQLNLEKLKNLIRPTPTACLQALETMMPRLAYERAEEQIKELNAANQRLRAPPTNIDEYIVYSKFLIETDEKMIDFSSRFNELKDLMQLMDQYEIKVPEGLKQKFQEALQTLSWLRNSVANANDRAENDKIRFTRELKSKIEGVAKHVVKMSDKLNSETISDKQAPTSRLVEFLKDVGNDVEGLYENCRSYNNYQDELDMERTNFENVFELRRDFKLKNDMWTALHEWDFKTAEWYKSQFSQIDVRDISAQVDRYFKVASRSRVLEEQGNMVPEELMKKVSKLKNTMPVVISLRDPCLKERHWAMIFEAIGREIEIYDEKFTLQSLLNMKVDDKKEQIADIALQAQKEEELLRSLQNVIDSWEEVNFTTNKHKEKDLYMLGDVEEIQTQLEDSNVAITNITSNRFVQPIWETVEPVQKQFVTFQSNLDDWMSVQKQYLYLENIFHTGDIQKQMPSETKKFDIVDNAYRALMKEVEDRPNARDRCTQRDLGKNLKEWIANLDRVQKALEDYLDKKRRTFPRFFFLSNDELLEILSKSKDFNAVQPHLRKCFEGIYYIEFSKTVSGEIKGYKSAEGEELPTGKKFKAKKEVETWLGDVEDDMKATIKNQIKTANKEYGDARQEWIREYQSQIVATVGNIRWTLETEETLKSMDESPGAMSDWYETSVNQLEELIIMIRGDLDLVERRKIVALVTQDVHNRDVVEELRDDEIKSIQDFKWQQQLRFYWDVDKDDCRINQVNSEFLYGHEYMGATTRLVITPLTDKCWITITGALHIKLGAAPAGPAGTGKTESTKDLAKALGIYCIVFNCSEQIKVKLMEKTFMGLCFSGSWACLDEFNRIHIEVLSVVAYQLMTIKEAKVAGRGEFYLEEHLVILIPTMGCFITMNPGYAGRTELPDNLKVLFRPVAMMIPDFTLISQIMLYAEGFSSAKELSGKMTKLYKLSSEQLSQQDHYDFGMRAVKSVLNMAGALKRKEPDLSEEVVLIRAMRDSNVPKFLADDLILFKAIVGDLFPGEEVPYVDYGDLKRAIEHCTIESGLQPVDDFVTKVIQLFETFEVRFGVMIVGPASAGKTTCYNMLAKSLTHLRMSGTTHDSYQKVEFTVLNPKAINMAELFGDYNVFTGDWKDGLASSLMRLYSEREDKNNRWIVFDGPVDSKWIENMNTVLDDNMMLCLANSERIKLKKEMRMLFEVADLAFASPATVSRCGMVYMQPEAVGWEPYVDSWIAREFGDLMEDKLTYLRSLFSMYIEKGLVYLRKQLSEPIKTINASLVISLCSLLKSLLNPATCKRMADDIDYWRKYVDKVFVFAYCWSIGGAMDEGSAYKFDNFMTNLFNCDLPKGSIYESFINDEKLCGDFVNWDKMKTPFEYSRTKPYFDLVVPTKDTVRFSYLLKQQMAVQKPIFITGVSGVGKSIIINDVLTKMKENKTDPLYPLNMTFSARTSSQQAQISIESKLDSKRKDLLGAPGNRQTVIMIDDVNMPELEEYHAQPPIELIRQLAGSGYMYDRQRHIQMKIQNSNVVCCAAPPQGGRNHITQRFTHLFHIICIPQTTEESMKDIFKSILDGFFKAFKNDVQQIGGAIVTATITMYRQSIEALLPTPAKSHYTFNLRDVSKVIQGMVEINERVVNSVDAIVRLWIHELCRVFHDRLINTEDRNWFTQSTQKLLLQNFKKDWTHEELFEKNVILFGDFFKGAGDKEFRQYEEAESIQKCQIQAERFLETYNEEHSSQMNLVFFNDALEHLCRICRILRLPRGNAMLVGVGGSGKQSLTTLAADINQQNCVQIQVTKGYSLNDFRNDIKGIFFKCGGEEAQPTVFLLTDNQIAHESFLEDINNILNSGEVPNLFEKEELEQIEGDLRPIASKAGADNVYNFFIQRVRENLHIVLCMSPIGDTLRVRMRMFPSLVTCTTINWVDPWPEDALLSVSRSKFKELILEDVPRDQAIVIRESLANICVATQLSVQSYAEEFFEVLSRKIYITPKSYLDMMSLYFSYLEEKRRELTENRRRYNKGVRMLAQTNLDVADMKEQLTALKPVIEKKKIESEELTKIVEADSAEANKVKEVAEAEERVVSAQAAEISVIQEEAQAALDVAIPALNEAIAALDQINKDDISKIKSYPSPPTLVRFTLECICLLLQEKPDWNNIKKMLSSMGFIDRLSHFDKDNIAKRTLTALRKQINSNKEFTPEEVRRQDGASASLCKWVLAMDKYAKVSEEVAPKREQLMKMNAQMDEANAKLQIQRDRLQAEMDKVAVLEAKLQEAEDETERLDTEAKTTAARLKRAGVLTEGLKEENARWEVSVEEYDEKIRNILGDSFVACACINYYGPFTGDYRKRLVATWLEKCEVFQIPVTQGFNLIESAGNPVKIRDWNSQRLPSDEVSISNGILVTQGTRFPLMIDPQEQAYTWIKQLEADKGIKTTRPDKDTSKVLENCIRNGIPLMLEDLGEIIDPSLTPVLAKNIIEQAPGQFVLRMGQSDIDYMKDFNLYLTTKLPNPHYLPEISMMCNLINFTVTIQGLEEQLLNAVVLLEKPQIERQKERLITTMASDQKNLADIESAILQSLSNVEGNILDDTALIEQLKQSKETSNLINERMVQSKETKIQIDEARSQYQSVAVRGSILYFVIADLANVDPMYQYSLNYFTNLFKQIISTSQQSNDMNERLGILLKQCTEIIFMNVCRGLFNAHKLIFSFIVAVNILKNRGEISSEELGLLLRGVSFMPADFIQSPNPDTKLFNDKQWNFVNFLQNISEPFKNPPLGQVIAKNLESWKQWVKSKDPQTAALPGELADRVTSFHKLLLIKGLREEKVIFSVQQFIMSAIGDYFVNVPPPLMSDVYSQTNCKSPVIFILSVGADPNSIMKQFAAEQNYSDRLDIVSLGQGQEKRATDFINKGCKTGNWVMLQNCHLFESWMPEMEKIVSGFEEKTDIHEDFRLYLTSMPVKYFPIPVLQIGVKITNEPPKGIKSNIIRSLNTISNEKLQDCEKPVEWRKLLISLCFFHSIVQERRKFGPLGWTIRYEFNESDLETSITMLKNFLDSGGETIPWDAIRFMVGDINYGGRATDEWDKRLLNSILSIYMKEEVLSDSYRFSSSGTYYVPLDTDIIGYKRYVQKLPDTDMPEIFGMHDNANITFQKQESDIIISTVLSIQPRETGKGSSGKTPDETVRELAGSILENLPVILSMSEAGSQTFQRDKDGLMDSMATFLGQEMARFNSLLVVMDKTLVELDKAILGFSTMSKELDGMYSCFLNNQVPANWVEVAYPSLKPLSSWVQDLIDRVEFIRDWLKNDKPPSYWLAAFFFPQGFLTAVQQSYSRKYQIPIDVLSFTFEMQTFYDKDLIEERHEEGVYIYGMYMEGCRWDIEGMQLEDSGPGEMYSPAPVILFIPREDYIPDPEEYSMPVYKTTARAGVLSTTGHSTNFIIPIECPTVKKPLYWILKGAAFLCQLND